MGNDQNPADDAQASTRSADAPASPRRRRRGPRMGRRLRGLARRWLWAILTFLMLVVGGVAACQSPGWLGPSHHEPSLAKPLTEPSR
ncbi:hypothetical protein ASD21_12540 [Caulobacter sp. Root1455]|jgi:hypothetical protein|uniref:hypothetical protein n=1 Tax=unclassified Caulobacter TaxID=2648921 RepID=UPI0006F37DBC|nr:MULTISPECIES: hypothetical protein [unclassified Caulobacter]KQY29952.1 hypothetical protein ASD38_11605 [Caulobacter sp. Root487D2Y]KQY92251.1 hypothetical protein ASD21_12540 [Caulobacter sp. Root1455]